MSVIVEIKSKDTEKDHKAHILSLLCPKNADLPVQCSHFFLFFLLPTPRTSGSRTEDVRQPFYTVIKTYNIAFWYHLPYDYAGIMHSLLIIKMVLKQ